MKPKIYIGKIEEEEDFSLAPKTLTGAYIFRNFSSDDNVTIDLSLIKNPVLQAYILKQKESEMIFLLSLKM